MKIFCLADEDTVRGFRLAGIDGRAASTREEAMAAIREIAAQDDIGLLVVTDVVASEIQEEIDRIRIERPQPLIAEIPGPDGPMPGRKTLRQFVQEAVGINVGNDTES